VAAVTPPELAREILYADPGAAAVAFQRSLSCTLTVSDAVALLHDAIEAADLWVLHDIDPQALLKRGGYSIAASRQLLFFHPRFVARLLAADPAALLETPFRFAALSLPGRVTMVSWIDPALMFARYRNAILADLGQELSVLCDEIVMAALGPYAAPVRSGANHVGWIGR
jgi:uncharacterized protein (DUF302 family)